MDAHLNAGSGKDAVGQVSPQTLNDRAVRLYPGQEIDSVESDLSLRRQTYAETDGRIRRLAAAFGTKLGLGEGAIVGTFAWNNVRHHELYWATTNTENMPTQR